jgi:acylphosphatase
METVETVRAHVWISGRVQGVGFRAATRDRARRAGVDGWVYNVEDGRVEAVFQGNRGAVQQLVSWCYSGPSMAQVERVELSWEEPDPKEGGFSIRW